MKKYLLAVCCTFNLSQSFATLNTPGLVAPFSGSINNSPNEVLDWSGVTGATAYEYKLGTDPLLIGANALTIASSQVSTVNLFFGTVYYWQVRAIKTSIPIDSSAWSATWSFTTLDILSLSAPFNAAVNQSPDATLDWSGINGISNYDYQYDTVATFNSPLNFYSSVGATSQVNTANLRFGAQYFWRVRARHAADTTQWSATWSFNTLDILSLSAPFNAAVNQSPDATLDWSGINGISNYDYQYDTVATFNSPLNFYASVGTTSQVNTANLRFGAQYFWRVRARHAADTTQWSATWSFTTLDILSLSAPFNAAVNQSPDATLDWSGINGISNYDYQYDTVATFNSPLNFYASVGATSQVNTANLRFGAQYFWRVRARHAADTTQWSATWSFTTLDILSLSAPFNAAVNQSPDATLDWSGINGISNYDYQYDTVATFNSPLNFYSSVGATSQVNTANLRFGAQYFWRVRARHAADTTQWSATWSFTTLDILTQNAPFNAAVNQSPDATLDWSGINGISNYDYQYDTVATFNSPLNFYASVGATSQVNTANLRFGAQYFWRVRARHAADTTQWSVTWSFTTITTVALISPSNNMISVSLNPIIDWVGLNGITGYQYRYSTSSNFSNLTMFTIGATSQATLSNLSYGTQYYWQVRTFHSADSSAWSLPWSFTTLYQLTTAPSLISPSNNTINIPLTGTSLQWSSVNSATIYEYQYAIDANFTNPVSNATASLSDATGSLIPNTLYYWKVRASNGSGYSPWSITWSFTTEIASGLASQDATNSLQVYPNPSNGKFTISTENNFGTITVCNVIGEQLFTTEINARKTMIDLSEHFAGIYFIKYLEDGKIKTKKLIFQ